MRKQGFPERSTVLELSKGTELYVCMHACMFVLKGDLLMWLTDYGPSSPTTLSMTGKARNPADI